jgi:hypothetical protein
VIEDRITDVSDEFLPATATAAAAATTTTTTTTSTPLALH